MSLIVFSEDEKHVEIEKIAEFRIVETAINNEFHKYIKISTPAYMQNMDKNQLQLFIARLLQMEKLL